MSKIFFYQIEDQKFSYFDGVRLHLRDWRKGKQTSIRFEYGLLKEPRLGTYASN